MDLPKSIAELPEDAQKQALGAGTFGLPAHRDRDTGELRPELLAAKPELAGGPARGASDVEEPPDAPAPEGEPAAEPAPAVEEPPSEPAPAEEPEQEPKGMSAAKAKAPTPRKK